MTLRSGLTAAGLYVTPCHWQGVPHFEYFGQDEDKPKMFC
jgi:hypothetical protein